MRRDELAELHYITPIENVASIIQRGILSNRRAQPFRPRTIAKPEVQALRARVRIPGGRALHEYANLYICARNPMMFKWAALHEETCVLRVSTDVLDLPDVVITDQNAASGYCRFVPSPEGLAIVDREMVFADDWRHPGNPAAYYRHRSVKCAEVLVPDAVPPHYILGAYAAGARAEGLLTEGAPELSVVTNAHIFFR
jgi:hypothetical protein